MGLNKEIFDFLSNNLRLEIGDDTGFDYGRKYRELRIKLILMNPETQQEEIISSETISLE